MCNSFIYAHSLWWRGVGGDFLNLSSNPRSPSMGLDLGVSKRKGVRVNNS